MSRFVRTSKGYVNLDHVAHIRVTYPENPEECCTEAFYGRDDTCIGTRQNDSNDDYAPHIPAAKDEHAVAIFGLYEGDEPIELLIEYPRIIAWSLSEYPSPIFADWAFNERSPGCLIFLVDFGGALRLPDSVVVKDLEGAKEFAADYFSAERTRKSKAPQKV